MLHVQPPYRTGQFICSKTGQLYLLTTVWRIASSKIYFKVICFLMKEFIRNNFILSLRGMIMGGSEGLTATERRSATKVTAARYQKATKKLKRIILEEFAALTGYDRCYAAYPSELMARRRMTAVTPSWSPMWAQGT